MTAYSIIKSLLIPPGILILLLVAAFLLVRGVLGRVLLLIAASVLALMSLPVVSALLMAPLEIFPALDPEAPLPPGVEAILVMGAGRYIGAPEYGGDTVNEISLQRIRYAAFLHRRTGLPIYISGGSPTEQQPPVGELMAQVLRDEFQVPVAGVESRSRTSWENAAFSKPMLERDRIDQVLLVSSASHLPRGVEAFEKAGIRVTPAPTGFLYRPDWQEDMLYGDWLPSAQAFLESYSAIHEHLGRVWYQIRLWVQGVPGVLAVT